MPTLCSKKMWLGTRSWLAKDVQPFWGNYRYADMAECTEPGWRGGLIKTRSVSLEVSTLIPLWVAPAYHLLGFA